MPWASECKPGLIARPITVTLARSHSGYYTDLGLAIITCIIQIPVIKAWPGYWYLTIFQLMRVHRIIFGIKPIGNLVVRGPVHRPRPSSILD